MQWEGGKPPKSLNLGHSGIRVRSIVSAMRTPQGAAGLGARLLGRVLLSQAGLAILMPLFFPIISMLIVPFIQKAIKDYFDAELKRKLEEERKKITTEIYTNLNAEDRALLRELVPG